MTLTKTQAQAIAQMAPNSWEYNRGVLSMLGKRRLAEDHESASKTVRILIEDRDLLIPASHTAFDPLPPKAQVIQDQVESAVRRCTDAWAPIQDLIDEARDALEKADPLGLDQGA